MDIKLWDGGLQAQEIRAIDKIKLAFSKPKSSNEKTQRGGSIQDQLRNLGASSMFPWKGYAGFRYVDCTGKEGEFDLVIVTHCNVLIIELKDWNNGEIKSYGDKWFKNDKDMGRSPVSITQNKVYLLKNKLNKIKHQLTSKKLPWIDFFVVMCGDSDFKNISEKDRKHTITLNQFLEFSDENIFNDKFKPFDNIKTLNQDFNILDKVFGEEFTAPKQISVNGYTEDTLIFDNHPNKLYKEYLAKSDSSQQDEALLRVWNFANFTGVKGSTPEGRYHIVSREREVLGYIKHQNHDLYKHCLRALTNIQKDDVTTEFNEVFELPPSHSLFNEFIGKFGKNFSDIDRINLVKLLVAKFSDLHKIKVAHRDFAAHSLWVSPGKEIALSNFISAYHQPAGTVGDYREQLSVSDVDLDAELSPFQKDVKALGIICWHIFNDMRISKVSLATLDEKLIDSDDWYSNTLYKAIKKSTDFKNAEELFDALKNAEPSNENIFDFDDSELEPFRKNISHSRQFREDDDLLVETDEKEVYESEGLMVKAWLNINPSIDDSSLSFKVLHFLKRLEKIASVNPPYLPCIREYGIATKSSSLYLVTDKAKGNHWNNCFIDLEEKKYVIGKLIETVEHLHGLGIYHGDLQPSNILLDTDGEEIRLSLIDIPDFCQDGKELKSPKYSPDHIDNCTGFERDNFAVMRLSCELLGIGWGEVSKEFESLSEAVILELEDLNAGFRDLHRFKKALKPSGYYIAEPIIITCNLKNPFDELTIYPDNGELYIYVEKSNKNNTDVIVNFYGIGGRVGAVYSTVEQAFIVVFKPTPRDSHRKSDIEKCQLIVDFPIQIKSSSMMDLTQLTKVIEGNEAFNRTIETVLRPENELEVDGLNAQLKSVFESIVHEAEQPSEKLIISTDKLWNAILNTETEAYPYIEILGGVLQVKDNDDELILPYSSDVDVLGSFTKTDIVEALQIKNEEEIRLGEVRLKQSALNEIRLNKFSFKARHLEDGDLVFFRTKADKSSYIKRKAALERILDHEGVITNLAHYFDPDCDTDATQYDIDVSEQDFERYDRIDDHGNKISLNKQQRNAFTQLVNNGPLSLLQGPPGTGKTEFIAAFVHYLVEKQKVKNILLVSQSHEAVNTAAERIRKHCVRLNTPLDVVRFSNREGAVSTGLKDVYSNSIIAEKRELFRAEYKYRVEFIAQAIGLQKEFVSSVVEAELTLFKQIETLNKSLETLKNQQLEKDEQYVLKMNIVSLDAVIRESLVSIYGLEYSADKDVRDSKQYVINHLCDQYSVRPDEAQKAIALANVSRDMLDVLETERVNYEEFFARSRQLVTGTCVGIGQRHLGIADNQYDWVIIDEAARSIASELAIAMQSGKRVLLVGDHKQLPPLYSDAHKRALALKLGIADKEIDIDSVLQSDFARAFESPYGIQSGASLLTQYRMAPQIGNIVSSTFYNGELENGDRQIPDIYTDAPLALQSIVTWLDTSSLGQKCYHSDDRGVSIYNRAEADAIINLLKNIAKRPDFIESLKSIVKKGEAAIGVICMYGEQKRILRQKFKEIDWQDDFKELVKIDTVDSYQGKENRIIILSVTRSSKDKKPKFLKAPNRINVAISRAMDRLLIVGATHMWTGHNKNLPLGQVLDFISSNSTNKKTGCNLDNIDYQVLNIGKDLEEVSK